MACSAHSWLQSLFVGPRCLATAARPPGGLPADRVAAFAALWSFQYVVAAKLSSGSHVQYYHWFRSSSIKMAERRGLGSRGFAPYGLVPQTWLPRPTLAQFQLLNSALGFVMLTVGLELSPPAAHFALALPLVVIHASQLFANTNHGMHKPLLVPVALVYLALAPQL